jgi:polyhydroxyalkanoate synthesis regulator protein
MPKLVWEGRGKDDINKGTLVQIIMDQWCSGNNVLGVHMMSTGSGVQFLLRHLFF